MIHSILKLKKTALIVIAVLCSNFIYADNFIAVNNGNYSSSSTWQGGVAPSNNISNDDLITINSGVIVDLDQDLAINNNSASFIIMGTLTGAYNLDLIDGSLSGSGVMTVKDFHVRSGSTFSFSGEVTADNFYNYANLTLFADVNVNDNIYLKGGNLSLLGDLLLEDDVTMTFEGGNYLNLTGTLTFNGTFNLMYKASATTVGAESLGNGLQNLTINLNDDEDDIELQNDIIVNGVLDIQNGKFHTNNNNIFINGNIMSSQAGTIVGDNQSDLIINGDGQSTLYFNNGNEDLRYLRINKDEDNQHVILLTDLNISEDLDLEKGILSLNNHSLELAGMISSGGTGAIAGTENSDLSLLWNASIGTLRFMNDSNMLKNLTLDGGMVTLGSNLIIHDNLNLTSGKIDIEDYNLELKETAIINGGSQNNYIITSGEGHLILFVDDKSEGKLFPIGNDENYSPVRINNNLDVTDFKVRAANGVYADGTTGTDLSLTEKMVNGSWFVERNTAGNVDINLRVMWSQAMEVNAFQRTNAYISHYTNSAWDVSPQTDAATETNGMFSMKRNNITSLSPFSVRQVNTTSVAKLNTELVNVYPNPANDILNVDIKNNSNANISIMDMLGREVLYVNANQIIDISGLTNGVYIIKINGEQVSKFTKQ